MKYRFLAVCTFGLEAIVKQEATELGFENIEAFDARVYFEGDENTLIKANLWLRCADRVYMVIDEFMAYSFEELFSGVKNIAWWDYIGKKSAFPVTGDSARSKLFSVSDIQSISKKAIVESLKESYGISYFEESEQKVLVHIAILKDKVSVLINTSGMGLNRRGYRRLNVAAPIRETLAAGLLNVARLKDQPFIDPMCGSGTIAIEAALIKKNIAPGIQRRFAFENYEFLDISNLNEIRDEARAGVVKGAVEVIASDVDEEAFRICKKHAMTAGVFDHITIKRCDIKSTLTSDSKGILVSNPPYAQRLGDQKEVRQLYKRLGRLTVDNDKLKCFFISSDTEFEKAYGKKADKKRKLYNGNIKCNLYQYFRGKHF